MKSIRIASLVFVTTAGLILASIRSSAATVTVGPESEIQPAARFALGSTVILNPVADTYVDEGTPNTNYGTSTTMATGEVGESRTRKRALLGFSMSDVPADAITINSATLRLYQHTAGAPGT